MIFIYQTRRKYFKTKEQGGCDELLCAALQLVKPGSCARMEHISNAINRADAESVLTGISDCKQAASLPALVNEKFPPPTPAPNSSQ